jgi:A1 cistron-splicing factor AAR2
MQVCYICFLLGHSLEAFEQWKELLVLICSCDEALSRQTAVYSRFFAVAGTHIEEIPQDFLVFNSA